VLANGFTENWKFGAKTDRNSVFLGRDPHIANRLSITVPYFNFTGFEKFHIFTRNPKVLVSLRFYRKLPVPGKNWPKLRISCSWPPYSESVIYSGPVFEFLWVLKNFTFSLEIHRCWPTVLPKIACLGAKTDRSSVFLGRDPRIANPLSIMVPYLNFCGF
jgi:hypothetical protein